MLVIGVTGGIGTGKSEVSRALEGHGAVVIDADRVGHSIYLPDTDGWKEVVSTFGDDVLQEDRQVDRRKLGAIKRMYRTRHNSCDQSNSHRRGWTNI